MSTRIWSLDEARLNLGEIMRKAHEEGPQHIANGNRTFTLAEAEQPIGQTADGLTLGQWLVQHMPRGIDWEPPDRTDPPRPIPFHDNEEP